MSNDKIQEVIKELSEVAEDSTVPKNVKSNLQETIGILQEEIEISLKVNKALNKLEELSDDTNIQPYTRTQLWNIVSILETI